MDRKVLTLKIDADTWRVWKILAATDATTMSLIAEKLIAEYAKKRGVK